MRPWQLAAIAFPLAVIECGSGSGLLTVDVGVTTDQEEASRAFTLDASGNDSEVSSCPAFDHGPLPPPTEACVLTTSNACPAIPRPYDCLFTPLRAAVRALIADCGVDCGEGALGFVGGCVTAVEFYVLGSSPGSTPEQKLACIRRRLVGTRFDCEANDGWKRLYVDSCTLL